MDQAIDKISAHRKGDISKIIPPPVEKYQSMQGFDDDYVDIVDYIIRCTHKIWEEGRLGLIYSHYQHNAKIWTSDGLTYSRDEVIANSAQTQAAFPDIKLYADDVIWSGNDQDGFYSSHRIGWVGHNTGYTVYGPPTGRKITRYGIADCFVRENRVVEEWIARDEMSLVLQLGFDPNAIAEAFARRAYRSDLPKQPDSNIERTFGQTEPKPLPATGDASDPEALVSRALHEIWNWRMLNAIRDTYYASNAVVHAPARRDLYGYGDLRSYLLSVIAALPDCEMEIGHIQHIGNARDGYRVAVRWLLRGHHRGYGPYGPPTGGPVRIIGISHYTVLDGKITEEWMCWDELALLKQIWLARVGNGG